MDANLIWPMWDGATLHSAGNVVPYGGIRVIRSFAPLLPENYGNMVARLPVLALANLHTRARRLRLAGHVLQSLDGTMATMLAEGDIAIDLNAVEYNQAHPNFAAPSTMVECANEVALSRFAGWYGYTLGGGIDGDNIALWLGGEIYPWGTTDEAGRATTDQCTIYQPRLLMGLVPGFGGSGVAQIGQGTTADNCVITADLPSDMGFRLQIGVGATDLGRLTGSLALTVTEWWGHGGRYDSATGEVL